MRPHLLSFFHPSSPGKVILQFTVFVGGTGFLILLVVIPGPLGIPQVLVALISSIIGGAIGGALHWLVLRAFLKKPKS